MTAEAERLRGRRHAFALPGGPHDRVVRVLRKLLPALIGAIVAVMAFGPLVPRNEVSFLLDRRKVAVTAARIDVDRATYRGEDDRGRPFAVLAGRATQTSPEVPVVSMRDLVARLRLDDGEATITTPVGDYNFDNQTVRSHQPLEFTGADGYRMTMSNFDVDLSRRTAVGGGGVAGTMPTGAFTADRAQADLSARTMTLVGHARLRMVPGRKAPAAR